MIQLIMQLSFIILVIGLVLLVLALLQRKRLGIPDGELLYTDSEEVPGQVFFAKSIPLVGKPDYIVRQKGFIIPIERKTGKTPQQPYKNHVAQLYAYCYLIEENYGLRPPHGIIRYPDESFIVPFEHGVEEHIKQVVNELVLNKQGGKKRYNTINAAKLCRNCEENKECQQRLHM